MWASDYPHWDAEFPGAVKRIRDRDDLTDAEKVAMLDANPRRLYGW